MNASAVEGFTNSIKYFLWFCAGADIKLLLSKECETERSRYLSIGATVLFTGILASLSGGYALYTIFKKVWPSVIFGIFWGLVILNLDRLLILSLKKEIGWWRTALAVGPRILLASLLSLTITKPLELRLFEGEIKDQVQIDTVDRSIKDAQNFFKLAKQNITNRSAKLEEELNAMKAMRQKAYDEAIKEAEARGGTFKLGKGPVYKEKRQEVEKYDVQISEMAGDLSKLRGELKSVEKNIEEKSRELQREQIEKDRFLVKYDGFVGLLESRPRVRAINYALMFIIWLLEIIPIGAKLISLDRPYSKALARIEEEIDCLGEIKLQTAKERAEIEKKHNLDIYKILVAQELCLLNLSLESNRAGRNENAQQELSSLFLARVTHRMSNYMGGFHQFSLLEEGNGVIDLTKSVNMSYTSDQNHSTIPPVKSSNPSTNKLQSALASNKARWLAFFLSSVAVFKYSKEIIGYITDSIEYINKIKSILFG